jgi:hypothetical protein
MYRRRPQRVSILLPGERQGRRSFLRTGLVGAVVLAAGGTGFLATRRTRALVDLQGPLSVFTPAEATVLMAVAERMVPAHEGFPRPSRLNLAARMDRVAAMADPATQADLRRLVRLFESALFGFLFGADAELFTEASPARQDERLASWAKSRFELRRTGFAALKRLVYASYYGSPETYAAVGYPGPPLRPAAQSQAPARAESPVRPPAQSPGEARPPPPAHPPRHRGVAKPFEAQPVEESPPLISPNVNNDG